eukprot:jgi/Tetstr1/459130/TSEL_004578.t1
MAVPAPPMSLATSSQHPATTASATADGAVAGGDALPGEDDAHGAPRQEAEEAVVEATDRAEDAFHDATRAAVCEASEKARAAGGVRRLGGVDARVGSIRAGHVGRGHENNHLADARTV